MIHTRHLFTTHVKSKGFTLVEMLVVLGLFSFIMTLATSVLYSTQAINLKLQESQAVLDNVNVSLETMTRDIRYGSKFYCLDTLPSNTSIWTDESYKTQRRNCSYQTVGDNHGGEVLIFKPIDAVDNNDRVAYYASTTVSGNVILKEENVSGIKTTYQITANDVKINSLIFYVVGASSTILSKDSLSVDIPGSNDYIQPLVTLTVSGETIPIKGGATTTPFIMQTSISSRLLDN